MNKIPKGSTNQSWSPNIMPVINPLLMAAKKYCSEIIELYLDEYIDPDLLPQEYLNLI